MGRLGSLEGAEAVDFVFIVGPFVHCGWAEVLVLMDRKWRVEAGEYTDLLLWLSGLIAVLGLGDLQFVSELRREQCEFLVQCRNSGRLPALHWSAAERVSLSLSQT